MNYHSNIYYLYINFSFKSYNNRIKINYIKMINNIKLNILNKK